MIFMERNIVEIDGKHYLELPCLPGDTVYTVGPHITDNFRVVFKVYPHTYLSLNEIVRDIPEFNKHIFTTKEAAEVALELLKIEKGETQ